MASIDKDSAARIAERYIATWNETDADRRGRLLASDWTDDARYADPMATVQGRADIGSLVGSVQQRFPGFRFTLTRPGDGHGDFVRLHWRLGPAQGPAPIEGSDVVTVRDGRIAQVIGFLDKLPG